MKKLSIYLILLLLPVVNKAGSEKLNAAENNVQDLYSEIKLSDSGLNEEAFRNGLKGYRNLLAHGLLAKTSLLTIVDFSQSSRNKRLYVIDLVNKVLLHNTYVAHGRNTGEEYAVKFSNQSGTHMSSLGFYITRKTAMGAKVGFSLIIDGIEKGINDKALQRAIIIHGADYATESFINRTGRLGRSYGCPSLPPEQLKPVIETIKEGSCLFIYHPDSTYLKTSELLKPEV